MKARRGWLLSESELRVWMDGLLQGGRTLIAPVEEDGLRFFRPIGAAAEACLAGGKSRWSPKEHLFPRTETLYSYSQCGTSLHLDDPELADQDLLLFGLRPCDAAGLARLDDVFLASPEDSLYAHRRARTTIVTLACELAGPECFCTAVGGSPAGTEASDVLAVPLDGAWLVHAVTPKGEALLSPTSPGWPQATGEDWRRADGQRRGVEQAMAASPLVPDTARLLEQAFDDDAVWDQLGRRCLGCSICAYVCPSCTCFDVHQQGDARRGTQLRCWDACTYALFTRHASGHNPRPHRAARYRQRLLHKFAYTGSGRRARFRCVGCGRCTVLCPAGIDIQQAAREAAAAAGRVSDGAGG